jgi:hypothetical protein
MKFSVIHHADQHTIDAMYNDYSPVFILSTGRSGSKFLVELLNSSPNVNAFHEPRPGLEYFSDYAFHHGQEEETLMRMIDAVRMESILEVFIKGKIYIESNQCMTFFAPAIARVFKKSKFVHIARHPGDFVRSAIRKGWHKNDSIWESGRVKSEDETLWNEMDQVERLSWLWHTTNRFIEEFKLIIEKERTAFFKMEEITGNPGKANELLSFTGAENIPGHKIMEIQGIRVNELTIGPDEPPNMKKISHFPVYSEWENELKNKLKKYTLELAAKYDYKL